MEIKKNNHNNFTVFGNNSEIDNISKESISKQYSMADEIKILRKTILALINHSEIPIEFIEYNKYVEAVVQEGKEFKKIGE